MNIFITGTDTNVGKTVISSWIALHSKFAYFKPIQTGEIYTTDLEIVAKLAKVKIYPASYSFPDPLSPHLASQKHQELIDLNKITLPQQSQLIIEGAGGLLVPINKTDFMIDIIQLFRVPVIIVARTAIGTINHTLLSIAALRSRKIPILGVIMNGKIDLENSKAIQNYGNTSILAEFPAIQEVTHQELQKIPLPTQLQKILGIN